MTDERTTHSQPPIAVVTGASGYVGASIVEPLAKAGYRVRVVARHPERISAAIRQHASEVATADAFDAFAVHRALEGADVAYYLVHTLGGGGDYAERDRLAARIFAEAACATRVRRIVYLGGLGETTGELSDHLASRQEVGRLLAESGVEVVEFRASIVIGSGSTSFEMIRNLVEKLPAMTTPRWVRMAAQPIAVRDVAGYLVAGAAIPLDVAEHRVYEIGGADVVNYGDLLRLYAKRRGLTRMIIPVPVLSPGLSGWWLYLFTPRQATVGRQLAESLRFPTVVTNDAARRDFPGIVPIGAAEAVDVAFTDEEAAFSETKWSEVLKGLPTPYHDVREGRYIDSRTIRVACPPEAAFDPIACIGGEKGWYAFDTLWDVRGALDLLVGGPGHRRGRRDQYALIEGDYLEWWRVETVDSPRVLRLRAEMKMPGEGWLVYELEPDGDGTCVRQTAIFDAKGLLGRLYWYAVLPFHHFVFNGTLKGIDRECTQLVSGPNTCPLPGAHERGVRQRRASIGEEG